MRELLLLLVLAPIALMVVLRDGLTNFQPSTIPSVPVTAMIAAPLQTPVPTVAPIVEGGIAGLIDTAMTWLGVRYQWGGCLRTGVDCSCFVQNVYATIGIHLPRTTVEQIRFARPIPAADARAGDLVFFDNTCSGCGANPTHIGLVIAPGKMVDAGDPVRVEPIYSGHNARYGRVL